jgi:hypothetical protein
MARGDAAKRKALEARLSGPQRRAALLCVEREMTDKDEQQTFEDIAKSVGVSREGLRLWRTQNKAFIEYVNLIADDFFSAERAFVYRQLMKLIRGTNGAPSVKGIDLYFKRFGLATERLITSDSAEDGAQTDADIAKELAEIDELIAGDKTED